MTLGDQTKLSRRNFLKAIGAGSLTAASLGAEPAEASTGIDSIGDLEFRVSTIPKEEGMACIPVKINDDGAVIGYYLDLAGNRTLFLYKNDRVRNLDFEVPNDFYPTGINGFLDLVFGQEDGNSLLYKYGTKEPITLDFFASGINDRDIVGHKQGLSYKYNIKKEEKIELGNFKAVAVDKQGRIAGNTESGAVVWENGEIRPLEGYSEGTKPYRTYARDISNGIVIGDIEYSPNEYAACMWDKDGKVTKLPLTNAVAINNGMILDSSHLYQNGEPVVDLWEVLHGIIGMDINKKAQIIGILEKESGMEGIILTPKSGVDDVAELSASYSNLRKNQGTRPDGVPANANWWYYDATLSETGGDVGVTIQKRQKCYSSPQYGDWCDDEKTDINSKFGTDYISSGTNIVANNRYVWLNLGYTMTMTETFWGVDDNGNNKQTSYSFKVTSD